MDGTWDLSDLYYSLNDPGIERDKHRADKTAEKLLKGTNPRRNRLRFSAVAGKIDTYAYLLTAVNQNNEQVLDFCRGLRAYTDDLRKGIPGNFASAPPDSSPELCGEYDLLLLEKQLRPGCTKQLYHPDEKIRKKGYEALEAGVEEIGEKIAKLYNRQLSSFAADSAGEKREHTAAETGFSRSDLDAFIGAIEAEVAIPHSFYRRKARFFGNDRLETWNIFAPFFGNQLNYREIPWERAAAYAVETAGRLGKRIRRSGNLFFENRWIDYSIRSGKQGGAFTHPAFPAHHPYILLNFSGSLRDTLTLIHELFHGIHFFLAERGRGRDSKPGTVLSETASAVGELMSLKVLKVPEAALHVEEALILKLFRQTLLYRWEEEAFSIFAAHGSCSGKRLDGLWLETNRRLYGDSVDIPEHYRRFWIYNPHFFHFPNYGINYSLGTAAALVFLNYYEENPTRASRLFLDLLDAGGSISLGEWIGQFSGPGQWLDRMMREKIHLIDF